MPGIRWFGNFPRMRGNGLLQNSSIFVSHVLQRLSIASLLRFSPTQKLLTLNLKTGPASEARFTQNFTHH